ncbi:MAG: hypothetical protein WB697_08025 [Stellaceae bacterium]
MIRTIAIGCAAALALLALAANAADLDRLAGLYVNRLTNGDISGRHFPGADVLGLAQRPIDLSRLIGVALLVDGVILIRH